MVGWRLGDECLPNRCRCPLVRAMDRWNVLRVQLLGDLLQRHPLPKHGVDLHPPPIITSVAEPMREPDVVGSELTAVRLELRIVISRRLPIGTRRSRLEVPPATEAIALRHLATHLGDLSIASKLEEDSANARGLRASQSAIPRHRPAPLRLLFGGLALRRSCSTGSVRPIWLDVMGFAAPGEQRPHCVDQRACIGERSRRRIPDRSGANGAARRRGSSATLRASKEARPGFATRPGRGWRARHTARASPSAHSRSSSAQTDGWFTRSSHAAATLRGSTPRRGVRPAAVSRAAFSSSLSALYRRLVLVYGVAGRSKSHLRHRLKDPVGISARNGRERAKLPSGPARSTRKRHQTSYRKTQKGPQQRGFSQWAVLGSKQRRPPHTPHDAEPESPRLQALLRLPQRADVDPQQLYAASRVVTEWSAGVVSSVNARCPSHLGCICVSVSLRVQSARRC